MSKTLPDNRARQYVHRLESLIDASQVLNSTLDLDELLRLILDLARKNLDADRGTIYLIDEDRRELWSRVLHGEEMVEIRLALGKGIAGHVAKTGETVNVKDASTDNRFYGAIDKQSGFKTKTMLCMPMENRARKIIGVFQMINKKQGAFDNEDQLFLEAFSDHAAMAIENAKLHQAGLENERVAKELQIAATIQERLLPKSLPQVSGYEVSGEAFPCKTIGGDYFDVFPVGEEQYAVVISDVSGKGIPASLLVSTLHASLKAHIQHDTRLESLVGKLNNVVCENSTPESFITFFLGFLNVRSHQFSYVNAGHNAPFIQRVGNGQMIELEATGIPLGMMEGFPYSVKSFDVAPKDLLVFYTDGVSEAMNAKQEEYGVERLVRTALRHREHHSASIKEAIVKDVKHFVGDEPASDDITVLVLKRAP